MPLLQPRPLPLKIMPIFGTRPEAIKMAPLLRVLMADERFSVTTVLTAQHREMLDQVLAVFGLAASHDLDLMRPGQTLTEVTTRVLSALAKLFTKERPDLVLVHGDTTTTFAASLAAFYHRIPVGHVEAGLRTGDRHQPFPEEINRRLAGVLADLHFAPTETAAGNLAAEGLNEERIFITGNTVIDALLQCLELLAARGVDRPRSIDSQGPYLLVTVHRRENWGEPLAAVCRALLRLLTAHPRLQLVIPLHPNPAVQNTVRPLLDGRPGVHLLPPLDYDEMVLLMRGAELILTDSGGIQEEAPALGRPVLVLRDKTERPEAVTAGTVALAGTGEEGIFALAHHLLTDRAAYERMSGAVNPYGDGRASARIRDAILYSFDLDPARPEPFRPTAQPGR